MEITWLIHSKRDILQITNRNTNTSLKNNIFRFGLHGRIYWQPIGKQLQHKTKTCPNFVRLGLN